MLPEVREYFHAFNDTDGVYDNALTAIANTYSVPHWDITWDEAQRQKYYTLQNAQAEAKLKAEQDHRERQAKAYHGLIQSGDKLVQFLMTNASIGSYTNQRNEILRALPLSREALESYGDTRGWCGTYTEFFRLADEAGVLPAPLPDLADVTDIARAIRSQYGGTTKQAMRLVKLHLPALLESAKVKAAEAATENDGIEVAETATA